MRKVIEQAWSQRTSDERLKIAFWTGVLCGVVVNAATLVVCILAVR